MRLIECCLYQIPVGSRSLQERIHSFSEPDRFLLSTAPTPTHRCKVHHLVRVVLLPVDYFSFFRGSFLLLNFIVYFEADPNDSASQLSLGYCIHLRFFFSYSSEFTPMYPLQKTSTENCLAWHPSASHCFTSFWGVIFVSPFFPHLSNISLSEQN